MRPHITGKIEKMPAFFFLFLGVQAVTYDEMKEYNCYTPRNRGNSRDLRCGVAIQENEKCEEMCRTADTIARSVSSPGNSYKRLVVSGTQLCEITFSGRCASKQFKKDEDDLCFTINTRACGYNEALQDCEDNGGHLYVPNSDYDLGRLINLTNSKISKFWFGGGSIFFRTCRDPSMGKSEEVAVQYIISEDDDRFLGYSTTRLTSDKSPYICAIPSSKKTGSCLSFNKPTPPPTTTPEPPQCSFKFINIDNKMMLWDACFPDGPLRVGDKVIVEGIQPACCPAVAGNNPNFGMWSINMHSVTKAPMFHLVLQRNWEKLIVSTAPNGWGQWIGGRSFSPVCPFLPRTAFKIEYLVSNSWEVTITGGKEPLKFVYGHNNLDPDGLYHSIGIACLLPDFKLSSVAVIRSNGIRKEIGLQWLDFSVHPQDFNYIWTPPKSA